MLNAWMEDPHLWKQFRQKFFTTISDLEDELLRQQVQIPIGMSS